MKRRFWMAGLAAFLAASFAVTAQEKKASEESNLLAPEDFLNLRGVQDPQFSPDGTRVAFLASDPLTGQHRTRHIWMYDVKSKSSWQFTHSEKSETAPRWSPDGKQLAFLSNSWRTPADLCNASERRRSRGDNHEQERRGKLCLGTGWKADCVLVRRPENGGGGKEREG